jgi:hypothetical protein
MPWPRPQPDPNCPHDWLPWLICGIPVADDSLRPNAFVWARACHSCGLIQSAAIEVGQGPADIEALR